MTPHLITLRIIKLKYSGKELEAMMKAWDKYTTFNEDCKLTRRMKELARESFAKKILTGKLEV